MSADLNNASLKYIKRVIYTCFQTGLIMVKQVLKVSKQYFKGLSDNVTHVLPKTEQILKSKRA